MANEHIKASTKANAEQVGKAIKAVVPASEVHKEKLTQKIYVGPNLLGLTKYTVVESTKVQHVQKMIKECAAIEKLFVPIEKMAETESRSVIKGTLENRYLNQVLEFSLKQRKGGN